jgi:lysophospholipase L1-like esterase
VEAEETAAKVIERQLPGSEVLNGGCSGWGSLQELAFLKKEGLRYQPDVVLLFYVENDLGENTTHYEFQNGKLMYAGVPTTLRSKIGRFLIRRSAIWNLVAPMLAREAPSADPSPLWEKLSGSILEMQQVCKDQGARLVVVYTPTEDRQRMPTERETYDDMRRLCAEHKIDFVDPIPALREAAALKPVYFNLDDHWTAAGHEAAGKAVAEYLRQHGLAPEQPAP